MILTHGANSIERGGGGDIPLAGDLTYQWNFTSGDVSMMTDIISNVSATYTSRSSLVGTNGFLNITKENGVCLNAPVMIGDYVEVTFHIYPPVDIGDWSEPRHIRALTATSNAPDINDQHAFVIYRGYGNQYWATYWSGWSNSFSSDVDLFNGKKLGIYLKSAGLMDIYVDNVLVAENFSNSWTTGFDYSLGTTMNYFSSSSDFECERVRIFRNCHY